MTYAIGGHQASGTAVTASDVPVGRLDNDSLIVRLHYAVNHLSRWLTPIHNRALLDRTVFRGQPSVKDLVALMRDEELRVYPMFHLMAYENNPNLDRLAPMPRSDRQRAYDANASALATMAEFRRLRHSTMSLLRNLPNDAWQRTGTSRKEHDWQIRTLAEYLAQHDLEVLYQLDTTLDRLGVREGLSPAARTHLDELLRMTPVTLRK
jgi:hypothetical protein